MSEFERDALRRYKNASPIGPHTEYESVHEAATDVFASSWKHGRELWQLHFHGDVHVVTDVNDATRIQLTVLQKMDAYWSEKAKDESQSSSRGASVPKRLNKSGL